MKHWPTSRGGRTAGALAAVAALGIVSGLWWRYTDRTGDISGMTWRTIVVLDLAAAAAAAFVAFRRKPN